MGPVLSLLRQESGVSGMKKLNCLRCGCKMEFMLRENIQLGKTGWIIGDWGNLLAGALDVAVYTCPECGKLEFFRGELGGEPEQRDCIAQTDCPACGVEYDLDSPQCPRCGAKNDKW